MTTKLITLNCGHQERVSIDGPYMVVERRIRQTEQRDCPVCSGNRIRLSNIHTIGFTELRGEPEQCARAENIRLRTLRRVNILIDHASNRDLEAFRELRRRVKLVPNAIWWIEHEGDAVETLARDIDLQ